ncbi:MAG: DUF86 domain-containing protein [Bacteroidetes bacterium]|nr:DUF86 domain-containing protein [Bacteroidota bacterium]
MFHSSRSYLRHIQDEILYLLSKVENLKKEDFLQDETIKRAFVRSLEIIGEATKKLPDEITSIHPEIEWKLIAGMRDRLIHNYFGVDYDIVWDVVEIKIPVLLKTVEQILATDKD